MTDVSSPTTWMTNAADGHRTLAEKAYAALHEAIVTGALAPGERLRIETLASGLGMSHLPIREGFVSSRAEASSSTFRIAVAG